MTDFDQVTSVAEETLTGDKVLARCNIGFADGQLLKVYIADASAAEIAAYRDVVR